MWEEAEKIALAGVEVYAYGLFVALGAALALAALVKLLPRGAGLWGGFLSLLCAFLCSRAFYCLLDHSLGEMIPLKAYFSPYWLGGGGYSMFGAILGAGAGAWLAGRILRQPAGRMLDGLAAALPLFICCARLGEMFVPDFGISRPLLDTWLQGTFLAVNDTYDSYLATYFLEAGAAIVLFAVLLVDFRKKRRAGDTALLFMLLFGASQVVLESLRYDRHISISFVGLQQVAAMAMLGIGAIILAVRSLGTRKALAICAIVSVPLVTAAGVGIEFAIDRTTVNRYFLYAMMILMVAVPAVLGMILRGGNARGQSAD